MKYTLTTDERTEAVAALFGFNFYSCLWDVSQEIRTKLKHGHDFNSADDALEWCRSYIYESLESDGINLDIIS